ncbi:MAG: creatininase family protein [Deltaproteobacteria bacterium]|nr:creatininase family protein [Deltaproteobacteria bacterium]
MLITEMTMPEFAALRQRTQTVFLPFGSTEEHGRHLPLDTDTIQVYEVVKRVAARRPVFVAPPLHYGVCRSTADHPGTIGISSPTLKMLVNDLGRSLYGQGLRNFVLISGHAGKTHMNALLEAGEELLTAFDDVRVAVICEYELAREVCRERVATADDSHAGEIETSRLEYLYPALVKGRSPEEYPDFPRYILVRRKRAYWPGGVWGNPAQASAAKGEEYCRLVVDRLAAFLDEFENFAERE